MSEDFMAHLRDLASDFGALSARRMFGGSGVYHDGLMIGLIEDEVLYLKTDDLTRARFAAAGSAAFVYTRQRKPIELSYWSVPESAMDSPQEMRPWLALAFEAALRKANAAPAKAGSAKTGSAKVGAVKSATAKSKRRPDRR
ncbi:TfoX/Sxy family protein [Lysobacter sp. CA199]|uniref:TfoX/Sxy family protein n=1 Tax=Lysobacter sp. CA199 TaxID=3455608 RepID=UPI003F8D84D9